MMTTQTARAEDIARTVLLRGLQSRGQIVDEQVQAWQRAFDFMNLSVTLSVGEDNGRKVFVFEGADTEKAQGFMTEVKRQFPLGQFEAEQAMIEDSLKKYANV